MTEVAGSVKQIGQGLTQTTYSYDPLSALVDIVTNTAGTLYHLRLSDYRLTSKSRPSCLCSCSEENKWRRRFLVLGHGFSDTHAGQPARQLSHEYCIEYVVS